MPEVSREEHEDVQRRLTAIEKAWNEGTILSTGRLSVMETKLDTIVKNDLPHLQASIMLLDTKLDTQSEHLKTIELKLARIEDRRGYVSNRALMGWAGVIVAGVGVIVSILFLLK